MKETVTIKGEEWTLGKVKELILNKDKALIRAMQRIQSFQTVEELANEETKESNRKGFNTVHAPIIAGMLKFLKEKGYLSPKQKQLARKIMVHYAGQLFKYMKGTV